MITILIFAIIGVISTGRYLLTLLDRWHQHRRDELYQQYLYATTRHTLPRAKVRRLRAARIALHDALINRSESNLSRTNHQ